MENKIIISEQPTCKTCGLKMKEWNPFADEHEHVDCISDRISTSLIEKIKNHFKLYEKHNTNNRNN